MIILGLDTSHSKCSVAISEGDKILTAISSNKPSSQAEELIIMIEAAMKQVSINYNDIDYLAAIKGPGSFTGIRIGLAAARGIIMASKIQPVGISSFEALNFRTLHAAKKYDYSIVLINAYRAQIYAQIFHPGGIPAAEPLLLNLNEVEKYIKQHEGIIVVSGSGLEQIPDINLPPNIILLPRFPNVDARSLCRFANMQILHKNYSSDLAPLYIRQPDAKIPLT
jgi:tRNA threonylcarbamoyl adenosine modification protein YeaZ